MDSGEKGGQSNNLQRETSSRSDCVSTGQHAQRAGDRRHLCFKIVNLLLKGQ